MFNPVPKPKFRKKKKRKGFEGNASKWCQYCGMTGVMISRHHIIKRSQGGPDTPENRIDLCDGPGSKQCHLYADQKREGYKPEDLRKKKAEAERWTELLTST